MAKIVYNACYGGFGLSEAAFRRYAEIKGYEFKTDQYDEHNARHYLIDNEGNEIDEYDLNDRADPVLVQVVEELGDAANTPYSDLRISELPAGTKYRIDEYDGSETVMTIDDYSWQVA
jgi:hypothetical protein